MNGAPQVKLAQAWVGEVVWDQSMVYDAVVWDLGAPLATTKDTVIFTKSICWTNWVYLT